MQAAVPETELDRLRRRNAELEARLTELDASLETLPIYVSYVTPDQRYKSVNAAYEQMFDLRRDNIIGRTIEEVIGEPHYSRARPYIDRVLNGERVSFASGIRRKDGALHDLEVTYAPHLDPGGKLQGFVIFVRDVTEERRARQSARERETDFLSVLNHVPDVICRYTPDLRFVFSSAAIKHFTGFDPDFFTGKTHAEAGFPEDMSRKLDESLKRIFATKVPEYIRFDFHGPMGLRHYEAVGAPEFDEQGAVRFVLTVSHDITTRRRAEDQLKRSEERQRLAVEAGRVGLWHWDIERNEVDWSDMVYQLHGLPSGTFDGTVEAFADLVHPEDQDLVSDALEKALTGNGEYYVEFRTVRGDGELRWILTNGQVVFEDGRPVRLLGAMIDVTESKAAADALIHANEGLRRANEDLNQFARSASHDLKEPLRMVALYMQLLKRRYAGRLDDEALDYINHAVEGARRMDQLVQDLLAYTETINAEAGGPLVSVDTRAVFEQVVVNLRSVIEECGAVVTRGELPLLRWREIHAVQVLENLIGNAVKYRCDGEAPEIYVFAENLGKYWQIGVRDNGIGIDARYHEKIFGIFKRLHGAGKYDGTGIGLAICQKIVERNNGKIWVESNAGGGSTFYFTCPVA